MKKTAIMALLAALSAAPSAAATFVPTDAQLYAAGYQRGLRWTIKYKRSGNDMHGDAFFRADMGLYAHNPYTNQYGHMTPKATYTIDCGGWQSCDWQNTVWFKTGLKGNIIDMVYTLLGTGNITKTWLEKNYTGFANVAGSKIKYYYHTANQHGVLTWAGAGGAPAGGSAAATSLPSPVPLPPSALMLIAGALTLLVMGRKREAA